MRILLPLAVLCLFAGCDQQAPSAIAEPPVVVAEVQSEARTLPDFRMVETRWAIEPGTGTVLRSLIWVEPETAGDDAERVAKLATDALHQVVLAIGEFPWSTSKVRVAVVTDVWSDETQTATRKMLAGAQVWDGPASWQGAGP